MLTHLSSSLKKELINKVCSNGEDLSTNLTFELKQEILRIEGAMICAEAEAGLELEALKNMGRPSDADVTKNPPGNSSRSVRSRLMGFPS